jgi:serine phosphatase RsbU (regulator of sigma subunit)
LGSNRELIVIGDATGHGVPAALVTAIAYASRHILSEQIMTGAFPANDPAAILRSLNTLLYQTLRGKLCMSFLALLIDSDNRIVIFYLYLMLHLCTTRFNVTGILKRFLTFG